MYAPNGISEEVPEYMKLKNVPVNKARKQYNKGVKKCFPDKRMGVSEEFPSQFRYNHQLISAYSRPNPYNDPDFINKSVKAFNKGAFDSLLGKTKQHFSTTTN